MPINICTHSKNKKRKINEVNGYFVSNWAEPDT
jgi:hypothetical protein